MPKRSDPARESAESAGVGNRDGAVTPPSAEDGGTPRAATIRDVAARAGVSVATVSRALSGQYPVANATRARVQRAVRDLDYVVNAHARALTGSKSKTIAVLLSDIASPFYSRIAHGVEQQASAEKRLMMVCATHGDPEREVGLVEMLREQSVDAVVLVGGIVDTPEYRERMARLARLLDTAGSRLVLCGRPSPGEDLPVTVVEYENSGGAFAAASYLMDKGHRDILFLGGVGPDTTTQDRLDGFRRALASRDLSADEPGRILTGGNSRQFGYDTIRARLLREELDFTAILAWDDLVAAGAMTALREAGVDVPGRVSILGYNDEQIAQDLVPPLTSVSIPHTELGRSAVRLALHREDPAVASSQHITLGTHIVVRGSVREAARR
ncbi:LacI family DNA-binding transcriptional regulator [Catenulispora pinisilvae]|uniref:LacI family DNA-binding transcriptional regulator n=1 Tax=Catenulispora pinisilvae TaxID=2705253 RepID=UPI002B267CB2|nr:LacI family DNA-binding transcriptional regulator [Catenulispora pinisilvae]